MIAPQESRPIIAVIGAGHAGCAAATRAADAGGSLIVFDEGPIDGLSDTSSISVHSTTLVWGLFPDRVIGYLATANEAALLRADAVIIATGATSRSAAFPGWTLPGVVTPDELDAETFSRVPAPAVAIVGVGSEVARLRDRLSTAGASVVAAIDLGGNASSVKGQPPHIEALGDLAINRVRVGTDDTDDAKAQEYGVDTLSIALGHNPSTELARMVQCEVAYLPDHGGWFIEHDEGMRASQSGYYVAGACTGREGEAAARAMGELAALTALRDLGLLDGGAYAAAAADIRQQLLHEDAQSADEARTSLATANALSAYAGPETVICPCEGVIAASVDDALQLGARTLNDVKRYTRCCMGTCQGRICASIITGYVAQRAAIAPAEFGQITARPPVRPVPLSAMAALDE